MRYRSRGQRVFSAEQGDPRLRSGLADWWVPRESGIVVPDYASVQHGTLVGGAVPTLTPRGLAAVQFNGTTGYMSTPRYINAAFGGVLTVSFWLRVDPSTADYSVPISWGSNTSGGLNLTSWTNGKLGWFGITVNSGPQLTTDERTGLWHHYALVSDGTNGTIYQDGRLAAGPTAFVSAVVDTTHPLMCGTRHGGVSNFLTGAMGDVRLYNRMLSAAEIALLADPAWLPVLPTRRHNRRPTLSVAIIGSGGAQVGGTAPMLRGAIVVGAGGVQVNGAAGIVAATASAYCTSTIELELSPGSWTDVTADVVGAVKSSHGIRGGRPEDKCAGTGTLQFSLNNNEFNSARLRGYYSPGHVNCRAGFDHGIGVRWTVSNGVTSRVLHRGVLSALAVSPGGHGDKRVVVTSVDWIDEAAETTIPTGVQTQVGQRADQILTTLLAAVTTQPVGTDFGTGDSTFAYALDNLKVDSTRLLSALAALTQSEGGFLFLTSDGVLTFQSRTERASNTTAVADLDRTMHGLVVSRVRQDVINTVQITIHPRRIDPAATTVLWSRNIADGEQPVAIAAGVLLPDLLGRYGDPNNGRQRCGGTDMVSPVATTDYQMFANADGTGADLTADLSVTPSALTTISGIGADGVAWQLENTGATDGFVTKLQIRGKGIYDRAPVVVKAVNAASVALHGVRLLQLDMPYQDNEAAAQAYAESILGLYSSAGSVPTSVQLAGHNAARLLILLSVEIGDRLTLREAQTGIAADVFVQACAYRLEGRKLTTTFTLAPADPLVYWHLGVVGQSEMDLTTVLGYG